MLEDMEKDVLRKKDHFLKNVNDAYLRLFGWHKNYGGWSGSEANDGLESTTVNDDKKEAKKGSKMIEIPCI